MTRPEYFSFLCKHIFNINKQKHNGIQVCLIKVKNRDNIPEFNMNIHCDLIFNIVNSKFWEDYIINYKNIVRVKYLGVSTYVPTFSETIILSSSNAVFLSKNSNPSLLSQTITLLLMLLKYLAAQNPDLPNPITRLIFLLLE